MMAGTRNQLWRSRLALRIAKWGGKKMASRPPDFVIGKPENPYLLRWWVLPRNKFFNIYLHQFMRSDDDRALHDHPWWNASFVLDGGYVEHMPTIKLYCTYGPGFEKVIDYHDTYSVDRQPGDIVFRKATAAHRVQLNRGHETGGEAPCMSLFVTGPRIREWGFHCQKAWVHWKDFVSFRPGGNDVGKGCDQ